MLRRLIPALIVAGASGPVLAQEVTYTKDIAPIFKQFCQECHGAESPNLNDFKANEKKFVKDRTGPRMNTYDEMISYIGWPDTGAIMRRLDDGKSLKDGKPGNMYRYLGDDDAGRQRNLALFKAWVGEGGWNLNRWSARGDVPGITKDQLDKLKLKY